MKVVKTISDIRYPDQIMPAGTFLGVEDEPSQNGLVYILTGKFSCRSIHTDHLAEVDLGELVKELEASRMSDGRFLEGLAEAGRTISNLKERIKQLEWEIEVRDSKVELPGHVAEAIEKFRSNSVVDAEIYKLSYVDGAKDGEWAAQIAAFMRRSSENPKVIMAALVNGYTVAPEPEKDQAADLRTEVQAIIDKKIELNYPFGASSFVDQLTDEVFNFIQQREALPF